MSATAAAEWRRRQAVAGGGGSDGTAAWGPASSDEKCPRSVRPAALARLASSAHGSDLFSNRGPRTGRRWS